MKAAYLIEPLKIEIREIEIPEPGDDEIVVKIIAANTCGTDYKMYKRGYSLLKFPLRFGHEFSGIISSKGKNVTQFKEGDADMSVQSAPCFECRYCKKGLPNLCTTLVETMAFGAFAEFLKLPARIVRTNVYTKPENLTFETAALLEPLSCVVHGVQNLALEYADKVLIIGAGPIGLMFVNILSKIHGKTVIVIEPDEFRRKIAKIMGASLIIDPANLTNSEIISAVKQHKTGFLSEIVIEASGNPAVFDIAFPCLDLGGQLLYFSGPVPDTKYNLDVYKTHYNNYTIKGIFHLTPASVRKAREMLMSGRLSVDRLLTNSATLSEITEIFAKPPHKSIKTTIYPHK